MGRPAVLKVDIVADAKGVGKGVDDATSKLGKLGKLGKFGGPIAAGVGVAATAVAALGLSAIKAASDAEQSMGAVQSVFGKASTAVEKYASDSATRLGLAKAEYRTLASVVGSQMQSLGQSQTEAADTSNELIGIGANLAATFGGSVSDAVGAVGSLLRGERDPIERYGVAIKAADVEARLAAQGQDKLTGAARKTAEATATLDLLFEQTKGSQGAFAREADTLAGSQARLSARFDDTKAALGARLLPIALRFSEWLLNVALPAGERFGRWLIEHKAQFVVFGATVAGVVLQLVESFLRWSATTLAQFAAITGQTRTFLRGFFGFADSMLSAAGKAFGWLPGVGPKIDRARAQLGTLAATSDTKLGAMETAFQRASAAAETAAGKVSTVKGAVDQLKDKAVTVTVNYRVDSRGNVFAPNGKKLLAGAVPLGGYGAPLAGGVGGLQPVGGYALTTAAAGDSTASLLARGVGGLGVASVVDARSFDLSVHVDGALDAAAVADQLRLILDRQARRMGNAPAYTR